MKIKINKERNYFVPKKLMDDPRTTWSDLAVYSALSSKIEDGGYKVVISNRELAKRAKINIATSYKAVEHLRSLGYIEIKHRIYTVACGDNGCYDDIKELDYDENYKVEGYAILSNAYILIDLM